MLKWINHWALCSSLIFHQLTLSLWRLKLKNKNHSPKINMEAFESVWATQGFSFILALNLCLSPSKFQAAQPHTAGQWWIGGLMVGLCRWDSSKPLIPQSFQGNYLVAALCLLYYVLKMWFFFYLSKYLYKIEGRVPDAHFEMFKIGELQPLYSDSSNTANISKPCWIYFVLFFIPLGCENFTEMLSRMKSYI